MKMPLISSLVKHVLLIFLAMLVRGFLGYLFFGSVDVPCFISMTHCLLHHNLLAFPMWNYIPALTYFLWLAGFLGATTNLSLAFCVKIVPIFFDALLASLLVCIVQQKWGACQISGKISEKAAGPWFVGLAYALCPIPILITSIHGQWDALFIFFLVLSFYVRDFFADTGLKFLSFGFLFGLSLMMKPVSLIFLPFFFTVPSDSFGDIFRSIFSWRRASPSIKRYLLLQLLAIAGFMVVCLAAAVFLVHYGFNLLKLVDTIGRYGNRGVQVFGLPFFGPIAGTALAGILKYRVLFFASILFFARLYYRGTITVFQAILSTFLLLFGLSGICPQYFMWLVPFILIEGLWEIAITCGVIVSSFLLLFYTNPWSNAVVPYQNMLSFAALKQWVWLTPPAWAGSESLVPIIRVLGDLIIPLFCFLVMMIVLLQKNAGSVRDGALKKSYSPWYDGYLICSSLLVGLVVFLRKIVDFDGLTRIFDTKNNSVLSQYAVTVVDGKPTALFVGSCFFNIFTIFVLFGLIFMLLLFFARKRLS